MKRWSSAFLLIALVCASLPAAPKGPQVDLIDNRLSVQAEAISLERLLQLVDRATGMKSTVPPDLAKRNISVRFSDLNIADAFRKMFQGQPLDYVVIPGQGVIVTAASQIVSASGAEAPPVFNSQPFNQQPFNQQNDQPFVQEFAPVQGTPFPQQQQQPPMVQTPFGPLPNPRAQQQAQPNNPLSMPGQQQNSLFPQPGSPFNNNQAPPVQILPANQVNTPFGTVSPFGTPNAPQATPNNGLFGSVPVMNLPGTQPR
jgi:hypothetical protein